MSEQQPEPQAMAKDEAIKTLRRYLPPHLLQEVLTALESEPRLALLEERVSTLTESIALLRETTDTAIKLLAAHVSHLALQFKIDHEKEVPGTK